MFKSLLLAAAASLAAMAASAATYNFQYSYGPLSTAIGLSTIEISFEGTLLGDGNRVSIDSINSIESNQGPLGVSQLASASQFFTGVENSVGAPYVSFDRSDMDFMVSFDVRALTAFTTQADVVAELNENYGGGLTDGGAGVASAFGFGFDEYVPADGILTGPPTPAVPLPAGAPLLLAALSGLVLARRRRG